LKQIELRIGPFFNIYIYIFIYLFNFFFPKVKWVCLQFWGPIWGFNIKNVWLTSERIRWTFHLVFSSFSFIYLFLILLHTMDKHRHKISQLSFCLGAFIWNGN
jgi:hypothetical protein